MIAFIDANRSEYGVEPICEQMPIPPSAAFRAPAAARLGGFFARRYHPAGKALDVRIGRPTQPHAAKL